MRPYIRTSLVILRAALALVLTATMLSCSGRAGDTPASTDISPQSPGISASASRESQTHLWGMYCVDIDPESMTAEIIPARHAGFTANVTNLLNMNPLNMSVHVNKVVSDSGYTDIDIDVTLKHPFPGLTNYYGYDVRGVFMGDGSAQLETDGMTYPVVGTDQYMFPDPDDGKGGPDGYTRWFNFAEFSEGGMPLFQYTQGNVASPGFSGTATLCPYAYFADALGVDDDLWTWLDGSAGYNPDGVFSAGQANTRNYYLRFPADTGITFAYAVIANWEGVEPQYHPSNAPEAIACSVEDTSTVWYIDPAQNGGSINLDISLWDRDSTVSAGVMEDYTIFIESDVLSAAYHANTTDMTPVGGNENYSTYHVEIEADSVGGLDGNEYWVLAVCADETYENPYGIPNLASSDSLTAAFRYDLTVSNEAPEKSITVITPNGGEVWNVDTEYEIEWDSVNVFGNVMIDLSIDGGLSWPTTISADTANDGVEAWTPDVGDITDEARIRVTSIVDPLTSDESDENFVIDEAAPPEGGWVEAFGGTGLEGNPSEVVVDDDGYVYICGVFSSTVDFDPGDGVQNISSNGGYDCFLNKLDKNGDWVWTQTWGATGSSDDRANLVELGDDGSIYVAYWIGLSDIALQKFGSDGTVQWGWTSNPYISGTSISMGLAVDSTGVYWAYQKPNARVRKLDFDGNQVWETADLQYDDAGTLRNVVMSSDWENKLRTDADGDVIWACGQVYDITGGGGCGWVGSIAKSDGSQVADHIFGVTSGGPTGSVSLCTIDLYGSDIYVLGSFYGTNIYLAPMGDSPHDSICTPPTSYRGDTFATRFDTTTGAVESGWPLTWTASSCEAKYYDHPFCLSVDSGGNAYVTGNLRSDDNVFGTTTIYRTDPSYSDGSDAYYARINSDGSWGWVYSYGSNAGLPGWDIGYGVYALGSFVYATGYFANTIDFAPNSEPDGVRTSNGSEDVWVTKHKLDGSW